jgi:hypothetical protein
MLLRSLKCLYRRNRRFAIKIIPTPYMADSITQGTLGSWEKRVGDIVKRDEAVANIETDKAPILANLGHYSGKLPREWQNCGAVR